MNDATTITQLTEQPSKTPDEAIDRLSATSLARIDALTKERDDVTATLQATIVQASVALRQRDELDAQLTTAVALSVKRGEQCLVLAGQRDELAACLRQVLEDFNQGRYVCADPLNVSTIHHFAVTVSHWHAALLRLDVRERLDDKLQAERSRRLCPRCQNLHVIEDGYCATCRECTLPPAAL